MDKVRFLCILLLPAALSAETIFLRNGQYLSGTIISQTAEFVVVRLSTGTRQISKSEIKRIVHNPPSREQIRQFEEQARAEALAREQERIAREQWFAIVASERERADRERSEAARKAEAERPAKVERPPPASPAWSSFSPVWRSALLPGWGQQYSGRSMRARMVGVSAVGAAAASYYFYRDYRTRRAEYRREASYQQALVFGISDTTLPGAFAWSFSRTNSARRTMQQSALRTNALLTGLALLWTWKHRRCSVHRSTFRRGVHCAA